MKKVFLLTAWFVTTVCSAQVVIWNGDGKELGSDGGFWNRAEPVVVEEQGNNVMKFTMKANPGGWDNEHHNAAIPLEGVDFKGLRRLTMRLKMTDSHNVMVRLEGKDNAFNTPRWAWQDGGNEWRILTYEFAEGPDAGKITEDNNLVLSIWPYEETSEGDGKTFYVDDIKLEGPMVNGKGILACADNSLDGEVTITGVIGKGTYQCTWDGDWHLTDYDDYALIAKKLAPTATKLIVKDAARWDEDWSAIEAKCNGIEIVKTDDANHIETAVLKHSADKMFDLQGRQVVKPVKGIYIVNGKKFVR